MPPAVWPVVERLLARHLPERSLASTLGDLFEDYQERLTTHGRVRAELWLARECLSLVSTYRAAHQRLVVPRRPPMDVLRSDLIHGWRAIRTRPAATLATVAVLTLGIGLVSAMFALADPYVSKPLPFARAHELYDLNFRTSSQAHVPTLADLDARAELFTGVLAQGTAQSVTVEIDGREIEMRLLPVSRNYFGVLGIHMAMPTDWRMVEASVETPVILTGDAASRVLGRGDTYGRSLRRVDDTGGFRVATLLTAPFIDPFARAGTTVDGFVPLDDGPLRTIRVTGGGYNSSGPSVLARLQPDVTPAVVEAALSTEPPGTMFSRNGIVVVTGSLTERLTARVQPLALGALAAGLLILVVCAANIANLLLVRGAARTTEFASREALGASRGDIARLVLVELGLLTMLGVAGGLALAKTALVAAAMVIPAEYTTLGAPAITARVVGLAMASGVLVMIAGMVPGWAAWRVTPLALFNRIAYGETVRIRLLRFTMTVAQTAIAVVLLVGAVLFARSYVNLITQDPGYDGDIVALSAFYRGDANVGATVDDTVERLQRLPGVLHAAAFAGSLVDGVTSVGAGLAMTINGQRVPGLPQYASLDFFEATGSRLVSGRFWTPDDRGRTMVVNESFAARCCEEVSPLGQMIVIGDLSFEVVGVVKDHYTKALDQMPGHASFRLLEPGARVPGYINYVLRVDVPDSGLALTAEREIKAVNAAANITNGATMRERLMQSINDRSFATLIIVFFGIAAIGVSAAGVVGVVGFVVARRTREIAVRLAIGATAGDVRRLVTREAGIAAAIGAVAGLATARWLSTTIESLLYGIEPADPWSFVIAAAAIVAVVVSAAWVPARRASRLSPTIALRAE